MNRQRKEEETSEEYRLNLRAEAAYTKHYLKGKRFWNSEKKGVYLKKES